MLNGNPVLISQLQFEECCCEPSLVELTHCNDSASDLCDGSEASILTELAPSYIGKVVRVDGVCYSVSSASSGSPVAVTIEEVYDDCAECCGDLAPCTCPCTSWPPGAWPCNGLVEIYRATGTIYCYGNQADCLAGTNLVGTIPFDLELEADSTACRWKYPDSQWLPDVGEFDAILSLGQFPDDPCGWGLYVASRLASNNEVYQASARCFYDGNPVDTRYVPRCNDYGIKYGKIVNAEITEAT